MNQKVMHIALDVDDKNFTGHGMCVETGEVIAFKCRPVLKKLIEKIKKQVPPGYGIKICYETTYLGFSLARDLIRAGYHCDVIASSLIPTLAGDRIKTDRLDAEKMALYYSNDMLVKVNIPDEDDEVVRQLIRLRKSIKRQITEMKNRLVSQGKIFGVEIPKTTYWNQTYSEKLYAQFNTLEVDLRDLLLFYRDLIDAQCLHLSRVESRITDYAQSSKYKIAHDSLICLRGVKSLTAMTLLAEIGDINRFAHPKKLVSYMGLDIAEYSSGGKERKLGITKAGSSHLRTCIVESQQILARRPSASRCIKKRREGASPDIIKIAIKCDDRMYKRSKHLMAKGKHSNKIKVACAREMVGFIWEVMKYTTRGNQILSTMGDMVRR